MDPQVVEAIWKTSFKGSLEASRNKRILKKTSVKSPWLTKRSKACAILRLNFELAQRKRVTLTTARHHKYIRDLMAERSQRHSNFIQAITVWLRFFHRQVLGIHDSIFPR